MDTSAYNCLVRYTDAFSEHVTAISFHFHWNSLDDVEKKVTGFYVNNLFTERKS